MFDIGFLELIIATLVGLLVIGPKELPAVIRQCSLWVKQLKQWFNHLKQELEASVGIDEIESQLRRESIVEQFEEDREVIEQLASTIDNTHIDLLDSFTYSEERRS